MRSALVLVALFLTCSLPLAAQQDAQFSMYMFNRMALNPAYAGARGATNITAVGRTQWVGIDGHPNTFTLTADGPFSLLHGGIGANLMVDQIGPLQTLSFKGSYAFRFNLGPDPTNPEGAALQIGVSPGFFMKTIDGSNFLPETQNDPRLVNIIGQSASGTSFDLGAGLWFNSNANRFWAGVSIDHVLEPQLVTELTNSTLPRTIGAMAGVRFPNPTTSKVWLEPSVHFRMAGPQMQLEGNLNINVSPMVFGISYRGLQNVSDAVAIVGFNANQRLFIAYSYDYTFSALQNSTSGSHEILLSYTFPRFVRFYPPNLDTMDNPIVR